MKSAAQIRTRISLGVTPSATITLILLAICASVGTARANAPNPSLSPATSVADAVPGQVIVQLTETAIESPSFRADLATGGRTGIALIDARLAEIGAMSLTRAFVDRPETNADRGLWRKAGLDRIFVVNYSASLAPAAVVGRLTGLAEVVYAEPNFMARAMLTPNDPTYPLQWAHSNTGQAIAYNGSNVGTADCDTDTPEAWDLQTGANAVIVAIIDTGVDTGHPEFAGRVVAGYDYVNNDSNPSDDNGHGTSCAGIAVGGGNNAQGVAGVAWGSRLMALKVLDATGNGAYTAVANGVTFAADNGAKILSLSLGGPASSTLQTAVNYAVNTRGCAMFAATGNGNASSLDYPAAYSNVISVGALSPCNQRKSTTSCDGEYWWGSNYGTGIDFLAPGARIHTTDIRGSGGFGSGDYIPDFNGTSSATPHAAGIGALVLSQNAALTNTGLLTVLQNNCDDMGTAGFDTQTGYGRMNAQRAVQNAGGGGGGGAPVTLFSENFEVNVVPGSVWGAGDLNSTSGADYWGDQSSGGGARVHGGSWSGYCADNSNVSGQRYDNNMNAHMTKTAAVSVSGYTNVTFSFWLWSATFNSSDYVAFQYWNGSAWVEAQRWSGSSGGWINPSFNLTGFTTFQWRWIFFANSSSTAEGAYVDDMVLIGTPAAAQPVGPMFVTLESELRESELRESDGSIQLDATSSREVAMPGVASMQVTPNPSRGAVALSLSLSEATPVTLEIFSADGRRVVSVHEGALASGAHRFAWDGRDAQRVATPSGIYFARMTRGDGVVQTERIVRVR